MAAKLLRDGLSEFSWREPYRTAEREHWIFLKDNPQEIADRETLGDCAKWNVRILLKDDFYVRMPSCHAVALNIAESLTNGFSLPRRTQCRDLGVTITSDLSSSHHVNEITAKAHKRANCILRCFASRDVNLLVLRAFIVYVRPILEYNSIIIMVAVPEKRSLSNWESPKALYEEAAWAP